jgi:hypothetical protein
VDGLRFLPLTVQARSILEVFPMTEQAARTNGRSTFLAVFMTMIVVGTALAVAFW